MKSEINKETSELEVIIVAEKAEWKKVQRHVEEDLIKNLSIKGFRKGKIPPDIAKRHIARSQIMQKSVSKIIESLVKKAAKAIDKDTMVLSGPIYRVNKISDAELEIKFVYPVFPHFTIGKYKGLALKFEPKKVETQDVNQEIDKLRSSQAMLKSKNEPIINGDLVTFDYEGLIEGEALGGEKVEKLELKIGSNYFFPGFGLIPELENQMIGLKTNDKKDLKVVFPKDHNVKKLRDKRVTFKVLIHDVKISDIPQLDDEFVKTSGIPNIKTVDELREHKKEILTEQARQHAIIKFHREAFDMILEDTKDLVVPPSIVAREAESLKSTLLENLKKQGLELKQYLQGIGITEEQHNSQFLEEARVRLKDAFIFAEIAKLENIEISAQEYDEEYRKIAKLYNQTIDQIKKMVSKEQIQIPLTNNKVNDFLIKNIK